MAKICFLDWLGAAIGGSCTAEAVAVAQATKSMGNEGVATLIGFGKRSGLLRAALVNGTSSHALETDDGYKPALYHPGGPVFSAALPAAEDRNISGTKFLAAAVAGYEIGIRVGLSVNPSHYRYWHTTGTAGHFAAAAAAGKTMDLPALSIMHGLGTAGTQAAGLWEFQNDDAMSKPLHVGKAALDGLLSALLAESGFSGSATIFEGERGFCRAMSLDPSPELIIKNLGEEYLMLGVTIKNYSSCGHTHTAIEAALSIAADDEFNPGEISKIVVRTNSVASKIAGNRDPKTISQAKFSMQYCVALALTGRAVGLNDFNEENLKDPVLRSIASRVQLVVDPEFDECFKSARPTVLEVTMNDGKTWRKREDYCKGTPEKPLTREEVETKFCHIVGTILPAERVLSILELCRHLERVSDMAQMSRLLLREGD